MLVLVLVPVIVVATVTFAFAFTVVVVAHPNGHVIKPRHAPTIPQRVIVLTLAAMPVVRS